MTTKGQFCNNYRTASHLKDKKNAFKTAYYFALLLERYRTERQLTGEQWDRYRVYTVY